MEQPKQAVKWEKVHIFISSTFNDMHAERDYLVKKVFPELQEWCERRKLRLVDIDLRWGVTEQDATHNRNAVKVCLERIDDCRPFFVCFLGQRRGWVPDEDEVSEVTYERFPELRNHIGNASVTELEILHALISPLHRGIKYDPKKPDEKYRRVEHAFFYLRDGSYLDDMPPVRPLLRETYTNEGIEDPVERERHDRELNQWRAHLEHTGRPCRHYTADWNEQATTPEILLPLLCSSTDPENIARWRRQWAKVGIEVMGESIEDTPALAAKAAKINELLTRGRLTNFASAGKELKDAILEDLKEAIAARHPDHVEIVEESELQKELDQQEEFLYLNSEGFIEREGAFDELDRYLTDDSRQLFVLTAPGGMGKTMLIANWIDRWKDRPGADHTLHFRFVGQSDRSTTLSNLLRFMMLEIQQITGKIPATTPETVKDPAGKEITREVPFEIPQDLIKVQNLWKEQLAAIAKHDKTVIVIDAINQLDTGLKDLVWLPLYDMPKNIKFIVSFRNDADGAQELLERFAANREYIHLAQAKPFEDLEDRRSLVNAYLNHYSKEIDARHLDEIIALKGAENPLFLKVVLSELRVFGSFASLADKIRSDFGDSPVTAFDGTLRRLEKDPAYSGILPENAVPLLFGFMAHARYGLSAEEVAGMFIQALDLPQTEEQKVTALETVHLFFRQVRPFLARKDGRFDFFYESLKNAALEMYATVTSAETGPKRTAQEWHRVLAGYFGSLPLWEDREEFIPTKRKVAELPYHLTMGEMWEEVQKTLGDLLFVEAKCAAGQVFELQDDYWLALDNLPEVQAELREDRDREERMARWTSKIIGYSRKWRKRRERIEKGLAVDRAEPKLPAPPVSCRIWMDEEIEAECRRSVENPNCLDHLTAFSSFCRVERYTLVEFGKRHGFVLQHAWNHAPAGPVHKAAEELLASCKIPVLLRRWPPDAPYNPKSALLQTLYAHNAQVSSVSITPDGRKAVSGNFDKTLRIWDIESGRCLRTLEGHSDGVQSVSVTPDGRTAVSGSYDKTLRVWDLESGCCLGLFHGPAPVICIALGPHGNSICVGTGTGPVLFLQTRGIESGPTVVTAQVGNSSDASGRAQCPDCGKDFSPTDGVFSAIWFLQGSLAPDHATPLYIPHEAFDDPRLLSNCPQCNQPVRFNPFFVNMSDKHYEQVLRRGLEHSRRERGEDQEEVLAHLEALVVHLETTDKPGETLQFAWERDQLASRMAARKSAEQAKKELLDRRTKAMELYKRGEYAQAEEELRSLLSAGFEIPGTHCHLARVLILTDRESEAREHITQAWTHRAEAPTYVIPRILFFQLTFALLDGADLSLFIGRLKTALENEDADTEWTIAPVLEHLASRLSAGSLALLRALSAAIDNAENLSGLEAFPQWEEGVALPLD